MTLSKERINTIWADGERAKDWEVEDMAAELLERRERDKQESDIGEIRVGRLPTMNQDEYPGLGDWWVQLRIGEDAEEVLARVYGVTPQEANNRAEALACRAAMLQSFGNSEQVNSPAIPDGWIKCSERLPAPQELIYIYHPDYGVDGDVWYEEYAGEFKWGDDTRGRDISTVTHWMEMPGLPAAPKQESE